MVTASIQAVELGITKQTGILMPQVGLFGEALRWMFRDVLSYCGNYYEIYDSAHGIEDGDDGADRGLNQVQTFTRAT